MNMSRPPSPFRFKKFAVSHHRSAMKVGVDGVLIGCWASVEGAGSILDVGAGCGVISLIMAQRAPRARIVGIEVDVASATEAMENVMASPWPDRVSVIEGSFPDDLTGTRFDLIVSNPPYFDSGVRDAVTPREIARHQGALSPSVILGAAPRFLNQGGSVAMVVPLEVSPAVIKVASDAGFTLVRRCLVRGHASAPFKRVLLQWRLQEGSPAGETEETSLTLEETPGHPTEDYRLLCRDFYLKF